MAGRPRDQVLQSLWTAAFAVAATVLAHIAGGGAVPGIFVILAATVPTMLGAVALAWASTGTARVLFAAIASQLLFHWLFAATSAAPASGVAAQERFGLIAGDHLRHGASSTWIGFDSATETGRGTGGGVQLSEHAHLAGSVTMAVSHVIAAIFIVTIMLSASRLAASAMRIRDRAVAILQPLRAQVGRVTQNSSIVVSRPSTHSSRATYGTWCGRAPPAIA
ncbi:hypothetical protein [Rarobacter faecitabidus]|uniref:Uncharacterized protein n=1 Tax=Rarobacter faecitabidus TaxID=13243 RepID=A0A542ZDT5_RARFA|nr:hypothetical protein [Rarobacter faecitabidus]TQL58506.1 hypothetical protein FB461_1920 [Rarobacter faecitabidus]